MVWRERRMWKRCKGVLWRELLGDDDVMVVNQGQGKGRVGPRHWGGPDLHCLDRRDCVSTNVISFGAWSSIIWGGISYFTILLGLVCDSCPRPLCDGY